MKREIYNFAEVLIDRLVPVAVLILIPIIIIDFFFENIATKYHSTLVILDYIIIGIFVIDLIFKYIRIRNFKNFIKTCWLDIIAIFPFFLIFRVIEPILIYIELPKEVRSLQLVFHGGLAFSEEATKLTKEVEAAGKISRTKTVLRLFENIERTPKLIKALPFYEQPVGKHHLHKIAGKKDYDIIKGEVKKDAKIVGKDVQIIEKDIVQETKVIEKELQKDFRKIKRRPKKL